MASRRIKMEKNKSVIGLGLVLAIVLVVVIVGGGAYFLGKSNGENKEINNQDQNLQLVNQDQQVVENNKKVNTQGKLTIYNSDTYSYGIGYSGIDSKNVYIAGDGKNINLFSNQSNIDTISIIDLATFLPSPDSIYKGTITFGNNQYKKFKNNTIPRSTTYLISGLKNNKSILISVENDSDNPNYLDLSSLRIDTLKSTEESSLIKDVINQPAYLKSVYVKNSRNYIDVDYIQMFSTSEERLKAMVEDGACPNTKDCYDYPNGYKRNSNPLIRTFEVDPNALINVYGEYNQYLNNGDINNSNSLITFNQLKDFLNKQGNYEQYIVLDVKNGRVVKIVEPYQE